MQHRSLRLHRSYLPVLDYHFDLVSANGARSFALHVLVQPAQQYVGSASNVSFYDTSRDNVSCLPVRDANYASRLCFTLGARTQSPASAGASPLS